MHKNAGLIPFLKSLKFRLILSIILMAIIPTCIMATTIMSSYETRALSIRESEVKSQTKILANQIAASEFMNNSHTTSDSLQTQIGMLTTIYDGRILIVDDNLRVMYDTYKMDVGKTIISEEVVRGLRGEEFTTYDEENRYIEMAIPIIHPGDATNTIVGVLVTSVSTDNIQLNASYLQQISSIIMVLLVTAIGFFGVLICAAPGMGDISNNIVGLF